MPQASSSVRASVTWSDLLLKARERCRACEVYLSALLIFAVLRLVVVMGVKFGRLWLARPGITFEDIHGASNLTPAARESLVLQFVVMGFLLVRQHS